MTIAISIITYLTLSALAAWFFGNLFHQQDRDQEEE